MKALIVLSALLLSRLPALSLPFQGYVESRVPSLQVQLSVTDSQAPYGFAIVKNVSDRTVLEYCMADPAANGNAAWNWGFKPGDSRRFASKGFVLTAALFTDGGYEGNWLTAAHMADAYVGKLVQFERISRRVDDLIAAPGSEATKRDAILQALKEFRDVPDAVVLERFKKAFPSLAQTHEDQLAYMAQGMQGIRKTMLLHFEDWPQKTPGRSLASWWDWLKQPQVLNLFLDYKATPTPGID